MSRKSKQDNAANEQEIQEREDDFQRKRDNYLRALREVLRHKSGVLVFKELFEFTKLFQSTFTGDSKIYLYEGIRNVGLKFLDDIKELEDKELISKLIFNEED